MEKDLDNMAEKLSGVRGKIGDLFVEDDLNIGEVVSLLMSMLIQTAYEAEIPPVKIIGAIVQGCQAFEEINNAEEEREEVQWLN